MRLRVFAGDLRKLGGGFNGDLVGEDVVAIVVADRLALGIEPAGVDRRIEAPVVHRERKVVAHPRD